MDIVGLVISPISKTANIFIGILDIVFDLASIFIGIQVMSRLEGRLKSAVIFLILAIITIITKEFLSSIGIVYSNLIVGIIRIITVLFILFAILNMKGMIDGIDRGMFGARRKMTERREETAGKREVTVGAREEAVRRKEK